MGAALLPRAVQIKIRSHMLTISYDVQSVTSKSTPAKIFETIRDIERCFQQKLNAFKGDVN